MPSKPKKARGAEATTSFLISFYAKLRFSGDGEQQIHHPEALEEPNLMVLEQLLKA